MTTYLITNTRSGVELGAYESNTESEALDAMARDAGYRDYAEACEVAPPQDGEIVAREVPPMTAAERRDLIAYQEAAGCAGDRACIELIDRAFDGDAVAIVEARKMLAEDPQADFS